MNRLFILVLVLTKTPLSAAQGQPSQVHSLAVQLPEQQVDVIVRREMKDRNIPGLQMAVVQEGKIVLSKSYGIASLEDSIPVNSNSVFAINSCTKAFTGVAIMQLVEEGKVALSAPISRYLTDLPATWQPITVRQLLTHVSGLPDIIRAGVSGTGLQAENQAWEKTKAMPMDFPTGEQTRYNQTNYVILGKIIEIITGRPFTQFVAERQLQRVGMPHTMFGDSRDIIPHVAPTYKFGPALHGNERRLIRHYAEMPLLLRPGAGLNSTADELARWIITVQQYKLFKIKATLDTMWSAGTYSNGSPTTWALGWGIAKFRPRRKAIGMSGGGRSAFLVYPDDGLAVVVLTNLNGGSPEDYLEELASCFIPDIATVDPITFLRINLQKQGFAKAIEVVTNQQKKDKSFRPDEHELNDWGYRLLSNGQPMEAVEIFKLTVHLFPTSWNAYDSYGEALLKTNQKEAAIAMYRKSLDLNPGNEGGRKVLEQLVNPK